MIGSSTNADRAVLQERLVLPEPLRGQHDAAPARERAVERDADLAHRDDHDRPPREDAAVASTARPPSTISLSVDGIEERTRPRRAVAARQPAVEAVGRGDREPQPDRQPARRPGRGSARASGPRRRAASSVTRLAGVASAPCPNRRVDAAVTRAAVTVSRPRLEVGTFGAGDADAARSRPDVLRPPRCGRYRRSPAPRGRCGRRAPSSSAPSTSTSTVSPTSAARAAAVIGSWTSLHSRSRSCIERVVDLAVERERRRCRPLRRTGRTRPSRARAASRNASSCSWSVSVSPGNPTMNDERNAASGSCGADLLDHRRGSGRRSPIASCAAASGRRVLQREVEVRHDRSAARTSS